MSISILMPAMSPSMEKGNIARWLKNEGDRVVSGDILAEIETDKATMEMEALDEGVLARIVKPAGSQDVAVNEIIGIISSAPTGGAQGREFAPPPEVADKAADKVARVAISNEPLAFALKDAAGGKPHFASPLARRLARAAGLELDNLSGSGPHGRIVKRDVEAAKARSPQPGAASSLHSTGPATATGLARMRLDSIYLPGTYERIPLSPMRRTIASRLVESKQTVPHFYLSATCEASALLALRSQINAAKATHGAAAKISVNDFVIKALASALQMVPEANVIWAEDEILKFSRSDIGVAVAVEGGLFTPVVRGADTKPLSSISREMKDFVARANEGRLRPDEYLGGSSAISNLGMHGISSFQPIINPPHALMLAVGAIEDRLVAYNGQPQSVRAFSVTMSCDHRAIDGVIGARLLSAFKMLVENPMRILV